MDQQEKHPANDTYDTHALEKGRHSDDEEDPSLLVRQEVHQGSRLGDVLVRSIRPKIRSLRRLHTGVLESTQAAEAPHTTLERIRTAVKHTLIGAPIPTVQAEHERLTKFQALAVLSSDAISSVAYATEAILITLVAAGSKSLDYTLFISLGIVLLLGVVAISYRQTIPAYPNGGGSYIVAKDNLGVLPGLVAAASLMIDYVLTVAVSISAGMQALATLFPSFTPFVVPLDVVLVILITLVNLRGIRESGSIFTLPTYIFIGGAVLLIAIGCFKAFLVQHQPLFGPFAYVQPVESLSVFLILRSFAAGCSAMTGVEAISNGVPAFHKPEARNATTTLTWMAVILGTLFLGITMLGLTYHIEANPQGNPTVIGLIAHQVFTGPLFFMYPVFQFATLLILTLAANTSYSDFPRVASLLARDNFLPHQFAFRGDRLAFSTGILFLAVLACLLLIAFQGKTTQLINLYAVGVFLSFTLSQGGMVRHWWRLQHEHTGWQRSFALNGLGALTTLVVTLVIAFTKFLEGAWIVVVLIPVLVLLFLGIHRHYLHVAVERTTDIPIHPKVIHHRLIVPLAELSEAVKETVAYARSITPRVAVIHVTRDVQQTTTLRSAWEAWQAQLSAEERSELEVITPTHRSLIRSLLDALKVMHQQHPDETLTVLLPALAQTSFVKQVGANPHMFLLKLALFFQPGMVVTTVAWLQRPGITPLRPQAIQHRFIVPIADLDRVTLQSLAYARSISPHVAAVHISIDPVEEQVIRNRWDLLQQHLSIEEEAQLVIIESPFRSLERPLLAYIDTIQELHPEETMTVILPEFVVTHWWEYPLHNQTAFRLKTALLSRPRIAVTDIPQQRRRSAKQKRISSAKLN